MGHLYNFGLSQEDERTEAAALELAPGCDGTVLSIASAGEMALSLLALGAPSVLAVDSEVNQLHLLSLKAAAVGRLERLDAIRFLGYLPAPAARRRSWLQAVAPELSAEAQVFWRRHQEQVEAGAIWAGRYERFLRRTLWLLAPLVRRRFERLLACETLVAQEECFDREFEGRLRAVLRVAFHPRVYRRRGMDPRGLVHRDPHRSLGDQCVEQFRAFCTATPARENYLLQLTVLGRVLSPESVPEFLSERGAGVVRGHLERLTLRQADILDLLQASPIGFCSRAHLSNLPDWLPGRGFDLALRLLAARLAPPGRLVWRFLHADRPVPADLAGRLMVDRALGQKLRSRDRFPFYAIVPARIVTREAG